MALIILNSGGGGGGGGGLANIPVTNADGSVNVPATSLKFNNSLVVANGNQAIITPNGSGGGSNTIIGIIDPTNTTQASAVGQLYYNSTTLQTFICIAIVSGVPATYTWNLITGITINIVAPTTTTPGFVGQLYVYNNNSVFSYYLCISNANNTYTWNVISSGSGSLIVEKNETSIVSTTNTLNFTGTNITVQQDTVNLNQANISVTSGGGLGAYRNTFFTYTYITSAQGQFPLTFTLTDQTFPIPNAWDWTVGGLGILATDYAFTGGTTASSRNPVIKFTPRKAFTLTLTPTSTDPTISYFPYILEIPPIPLPFVAGSFVLFGTFNGRIPFRNKAYFNLSGTDLFIISPELNNLNLQCTSVISARITNDTGSANPTISVTVADINANTPVTSSNIPSPFFPINYVAQITAVMENSDGTSTRVIEESNVISYYVPAFWIQNGNLTAPTFDITATLVSLSDYQAGQSILFNGGTGIQVIWVAFPSTTAPPTPPITPPQAFVVFQDDNTYTGTADLISTTGILQAIAGPQATFNYYIYGYQIGYTGNTTYPATLFLEAILTDTVKSDSNIIVEAQANETQVTETPKLGFFQRLFGAKS